MSLDEVEEIGMSIRPCATLCGLFTSKLKIVEVDTLS